MNYKHWIGCTALVLSACQFQSQSTQGRFSLNIEWPKTFTTQVIPSDTENLKLTITDTDSTLVNESFSRSSLDTQRKYTLDIGSKNVRVDAFDANGVLLASSETNVNILPNATARAEIDLKPVAIPTPSPTSPNSGQGSTSNGGTSTSDTPDPTQSLSPSSGSGPSPETSSNPTLNPSPTPTAVNSSGGSSGGSSGSSGGSSGSTTTSTVVLDSITVDPNTISAGYVARLEASVTDPTEILTNADYIWSCEIAGSTCTAPQKDPNNAKVAYWTAPDTAASSGSLTYTLKLFLENQSSQEKTVTITVNEDTGTVSGDNPNINGGGGV